MSLQDNYNQLAKVAVSKWQSICVTDGQTALALVGQLHLALRHPMNRGPSSMFTRRFLNQLIRELDTLSPGIGAILNLGSSPAFDFQESFGANDQDGECCVDETFFGGSQHCSFRIEEQTTGAVIIRDLKLNGKSVTNDAEHAVKLLQEHDVLKPGLQLYYFDGFWSKDESLEEEQAIRHSPRRLH